MRLITNIKKNNGSTLTLVLFMLFLLSVTAIAVITITGSELSMSVMTSDRSKALLAAQAGAEKAAQVLDEAVAQAQEDARVKSSDVIQDMIEEFKSGTPTSGTPFDQVIDISDPSDIKILNEEALNKIYYQEYKYWFNKEINDWFSAQTSTGDWRNGKRHDIISDPNGKYIYESVEPIKSTDELRSVDTSNSSQLATTSIALTSNGEYKSIINGSIYKRAIKAEFGLLTDTKSGTSEIPISYGKLTKVRVNKNEKPSILKEKALIAEKNIISIGGMVKVTGTAICVGTIPIDATTQDKFKVNTNGYNYGGLMAGVTTSIWSDKNFCDGVLSLGESLPSDVFNLPYGFSNYAGSFKINGSVGTLAYIHSLYGTDVSHSDITVSGDTFARSVKAESQAHFTQAQFKNVYTTDDLKIDASSAVVKIGDWINEEHIPNTDTNTTHEGLLVGLNTGTLSTYSSAVAVSGDSKLYINGSVYIGGSTYYNEYTDLINHDMFISGMSILKSDSKPAQAFEISDIDSTPEPTTEDFPGNVFYYYDNDPSSTNKYIYVSDINTQHKLISSGYEYKQNDLTSSSSIEMMAGMPSSTGEFQPFDILRRAMHFKYIWDVFWTDEDFDIGYRTYINSGDIVIKPDDGDKLKGWCNGAVGANNKVYGPYGGFTDNDGGAKYVVQKNQGNSAYVNLMGTFVKETADLTRVTPQKKLTGNITPTDNSVKTDSLLANEFIKSNSKTFMYNGDGNVVLTDSYVGNSGNDLSKDSDGYIRGIVYSNKDIYVKEGTKFKGILIAKGNIVFLGDAEIIYDEDVVDMLLSEEPKVGRFFNYSAKDILMNNESAIIQTVKKADVKNIKIITWKEV